MFITENGVGTLLSRLLAWGSVVRHGQIGCSTYTRTVRGEQHLRVLDAALPARPARVLLRVPSDPEPTRLLIPRLAADLQVTRFVVHQGLYHLEALDLIVRSGEGRGSRSSIAYALTELGEATLPDARLVVDFVDGAP